MQRRPGDWRLLERSPSRSEAQPRRLESPQGLLPGPARCGALTPPWPRSASASAARVTVTKHSAPPCHNKSPGAPAAGDPYPPLAGRGRHPARADGLGDQGAHLGVHALPPPPRARPHARPRTALGADSPPHLRGRSLTSVPPPGCLCWCHASNPRRRAATRHASGRSRGAPGGPWIRGSSAAGSRAARVGGAGGRKRTAGTQRRFQPFLQVPGGGSRAWVWAALGACLRVRLSVLLHPRTLPHPTRSS